MKKCYTHAKIKTSAPMGEDYLSHSEHLLCLSELRILTSAPCERNERAEGESGSVPVLCERSERRTQHVQARAAMRRSSRQNPRHVSGSKKQMLKQVQHDIGKKAAFTLAEVLITIGVIGVVAALTIPTLMQGIGERANSEKEANTAQKITKSMNLMRADGKLETVYPSTDAFVDELSKYLKIVTRCDSAHLTNCWPTEKVTTSDGEEYEVAKAKKGAQLSIPGNKTDNVGIVLADGTSIILTYNENAELIGDGDTVTPSFKTLPIGFGKTKDFAYTSNVTNPIAFVMDVNGFHGPNSETINNKMHDIRSFNGASFDACQIRVPGIGCVTVLNGVMNWQAAMDACSSMGASLPDLGTLKSIYNERVADPSLGLPTSGEYWSYSEGPAGFAYHVSFRNGGTHYYPKSDGKYAMCLSN